MIKATMFLALCFASDMHNCTIKEIDFYPRQNISAEDRCSNAVDWQINREAELGLRTINVFCLQ